MAAGNYRAAMRVPALKLAFSEGPVGRLGYVGATSVLTSPPSKVAASKALQRLMIGLSM
jgi:hypothetical protein